MRTLWTSMALLAAVTIITGEAAAQRGTETALSRRYRTTGGEAAEQRYLAAEAAKESQASEWDKALQHVEFNVRYEAMETLFSKARAGESINEAIPALRQCATGVFPFPTSDEREHRRKRAFEALRYVDSDFVAEHLAKYLGDHARADFNDVDYAFAQQTLSKLDAISVNIDDDLIRALAPTSHSSIRQQPSRKNLEGQLLYVLAKLGTDRERVGKLVLSRMRWPLGTTYYTDDHYRSVRLCAEQCGSLFPSLQQAYQADIDRTSSQAMIAALAVYHDDAWAFFDDYLQDRFVSDYIKRGMATAFADTWLRTSKTTQQETSARILASAAGITPWLHGRSASQISRLNYNEGSKQDVLKGMREGLGGEIPMPKTERPTGPRDSARRSR